MTPFLNYRCIFWIGFSIWSVISGNYIQIYRTNYNDNGKLRRHQITFTLSTFSGNTVVYLISFGDHFEIRNLRAS